MAVLEKSDDANLRNKYPLYIEIGLFLSLGLLVVAFNVQWQSENNFEIEQNEQETVEMKQIEQTQQIEKPPPPPEPQVPVEVPNEESVEDASIDLSAELDMSGNQNQQQPPPPPEEEEEEETEPEVFVAVENMPELIGGIGGLQQKINYPEMARKAGVEGRVIVQFEVTKEGNVANPRILQGIGAGCDKEALRVVREAQFKPGKQRGKPVRVKMSLPITFSLG
mgnify:CR=1 FL=1